MGKSRYIYKWEWFFHVHWAFGLAVVFQPEEYSILIGPFNFGRERTPA